MAANTKLAVYANFTSPVAIRKNATPRGTRRQPAKTPGVPDAFHYVSGQTPYQSSTNTSVE